jgi:hypothetical protein
MRVLAVTFGVLLLLGAATAQPGPVPDTALWEQVLGWLGWSKDAPLVTRGRTDRTVEGVGELWFVDHQGGAPAPAGIGVLLRSPLPTGDGSRLFALTLDSIVEVSLRSGKMATLSTFPQEHQPAHLLRRQDGRVYALSTDGCLVSFSATLDPVWREHTCALNDRQRLELISRSRQCADAATGERYEKGPPARTDIFIRHGRISRRLTQAAERRVNYDPVFAAGCERIYFVSRERR